MDGVERTLIAFDSMPRFAGASWAWTFGLLALVSVGLFGCGGGEEADDDANPDVVEDGVDSADAEADGTTGLVCELDFHCPVDQVCLDGRCTPVGEGTGLCFHVLDRPARTAVLRFAGVARTGSTANCGPRCIVLHEQKSALDPAPPSVRILRGGSGVELQEEVYESDAPFFNQYCRGAIEHPDGGVVIAFDSTRQEDRPENCDYFPLYHLKDGAISTLASWPRTNLPAEDGWWNAALARLFWTPDGVLHAFVSPSYNGCIAHLTVRDGTSRVEFAFCEPVRDGEKRNADALAHADGRTDVVVAWKRTYSSNDQVTWYAGGPDPIATRRVLRPGVLPALRRKSGRMISR
jgi:hypothetical protein